MPREKNPASEKAEKLYRSGHAMADIAKKLGIPEGTVRCWKNRGKWDSPPAKKKQCNVAKEKIIDNATIATKRKRGRPRKGEEKPKPKKKVGAPKGNMNAVGGKGNPNPTPPVIHGGYSRIYWDTLTPEEQQMIDEIPKDEEQLLIEQIQLFSVRERRLMAIINKYRNMVDANGKEIQVAMQISNRSETKRVFDGSPEHQEEQRNQYEEMILDKVDSGSRMPGRDVNLFTQTENKDGLIARLESELSNVQSKKTKAIDALIKLHMEKERIEGGVNSNDVVKTWAEALMNTWEGNADE